VARSTVRIFDPDVELPVTCSVSESKQSTRHPDIVYWCWHLSFGSGVYHYFLRRLREESIQEKTRDGPRLPQLCNIFAKSSCILETPSPANRNTDVSNLLHLLRPKPIQAHFAQNFL
jgi:hypothetical protein